MYNVKLTVNEIVDLRALLQKSIKEREEEIVTYSQAICKENDSKRVDLYIRCRESCRSDIESFKNILEKLYNA